MRGVVWHSVALNGEAMVVAGDPHHPEDQIEGGNETSLGPQKG